MRLDEITAEPWEFIIDHAEKLPQGIHLWYKGVPYPRRVYYDKKNDINFFLRVLRALGNVKKYLFALTFLKSVVIPRTLNIKKYEAFLEKLYMVFWWDLNEFFLKDDEYSVPVWEMGKFVRQFLKALGLNGDLSDKYAQIVMMILEFDNAYRYRAQDLLGEVGEVNRKTLKYIIQLYLKREFMGVKWKIAHLIKLLSYALWIPKVKNALKKAHEGIDFNKFKLDKNDRYHVSFWRGYDYFGQDFETRYLVFLDAHKNGFPPYRKREDPELTARFMLGN